MNKFLFMMLLLAAAFEAGFADETHHVQLDVHERAGIARRYDVVSARLPLPAGLGPQTAVRVLRNGDPIPAQVRHVEADDAPVLVLAIDFVDHFAPFESKRYEVEIGSSLPAPAPRAGLELTETDTSYRVVSGQVVEWIINKDLSGLLRLAYRQLDYVAKRSAGLYFVTASGSRHRLAERAATVSRVERSGPLACSLVFEHRDWPAGNNSRVQIEFLRTKSWVHVVWTLDGQPQDVDRLGAELQLLVDGPEPMVDFGAGDFVYTTVAPEISARLEAGPANDGDVPWQVLRGPADSRSPIVMAAREFKTPFVSGWAHVMDQRRCTALAVAGFARETRDHIEIHGEGALDWGRSFATAANREGPRRLEFWLHFVSAPVHIGARTSPRSMQEPLEVQWVRERP